MCEVAGRERDGGDLMIKVKRIGLAALSLAGVLLFTVPASAAASGAAAMVPASVAPAGGALPHTDIKGSPAVYSPTKLTVTPRWNGTSSCTTAVESFTIANETSVAQEITSGGMSLGSLPAHDKAGICINTDQAGMTDKFGLTSNKKAKLSVKVT
jgi:hypothetical protein